MVTRRIWVDGWQMQCCGEPFAIGSTVTWTFAADVDHEFLGVVLGDAAASLITDAEEHHGDERVGSPPVQGIVRSIEGVACRFAPRGDSGPLYPVPGTAVVNPQSSADGWEHEDEDVDFLGYVVALDVVEGDLDR